MARGPLTIDLGIAAALLGFLAIGLLAVGDRRNGQLGIVGLALLGLGLLLAVAAATTVQF
jgi:threonine/homoserine efflux transporter RhtA